MAQRDEIERKNVILEQSQQIIADKNERMISSIEYARTIQNALLPKPEKFSELFSDYFVIYQPKDIVSGDFYWISSDERYSYAAVMDCTGHGVPGAFMSMIGNILLNKIVIEWGVNQPSKVLEALNEQLREALKQKEVGNIVLAGIDIAFVTIDKHERKISFSGAARPMLIIQNGEMQLVKGSIRSTGGFNRQTPNPLMMLALIYFRQQISTYFPMVTPIKSVSIKRNLAYNVLLNLSINRIANPWLHNATC